MPNSHHKIAYYLDLITERMIPPEGQWPSAVALRVGEDILGHLRPSEAHLVEAALELIAPYPDFIQMSGGEQDAAIQTLEKNDHAAFSLIRQVAYLAYYAQPEVINVLQAMGHDISLTPGPEGYRMDPFSAADVPTPRGTWIPTEQVRIRTESRVS